MKLDAIVPWDVNMCTSYFNWGIFHLGGICNGKQLNFLSVSFDNVGGAFVSFDTFLVMFILV